MINKLITWIYRSKLGEWYLNYLLWKSNRILEREIDAATISNADAGIHFVHDSIAQKYKEGISKIKKVINDKTKTLSYDQALRDYNDLMTLAREPNTTEAKIKSIIYSRAVGKTVDIKSNKDKENMIQQRIEAYYELQKHKEERAKRRQERLNNGKNT